MDLPRTPPFTPRLAAQAVVATLSLLLWAGTSLGETARGRVYVDTDRDRTLGAGESGLEGVAVSNGREVVRTDAEGRWTLEVEDGDVVFLTKPRDHSLPLGEDGYPEFFVIHRPEGTPRDLDLTYSGVSPTGPLPDPIDFPLWPEDEPDNFELLCFADTQPRNHRELDFLRDDVLRPLLDHPARAALVLGDVLYDDFAIAPRLKRLMGTLGVPWFAVPGNHDLNLRSPDDERSLESFKRLFGPPNYSFDIGRVHFVVLDDVDYAGAEEDGGKGVYRGAFLPEQLRWLSSDLGVVPQDRLVVLAVHIPLRSEPDDESPVLNVLEPGPLYEILSKREHLLVLAGHAHFNQQLYLGAEEGWPGPRPLHQQTVGAACGSWWSGPLDARGIPVSTQIDGSPNGVLLLEIAGTDYRSRWLSASEPMDLQMRLTLDISPHRRDPSSLRDLRPDQLLHPTVPRPALPSARVVVNFFAGGPHSQLSMSVGDGLFLPMQRVLRTDPFVEELYARYRESIPSWVRPVRSTHIWQSLLPRDIRVGANPVRIRAVDEFGQTHRGSLIVEIAED